MNFEKNIIEEKIFIGIGEPVIKKYIKGNLLGKGVFSEYYEITQIDTKKKFAIKIINKKNFKINKNKEKLMSEIKIHKLITHKNVLNFDHYFEDNLYIYIILELCEFGSFTNIWNTRIRFTEDEIKYFLIQIVKGLKYLHNNKIIHRDLNTDNILVNKDFEVKISDFGLSTKLRKRDEIKFTIWGSPNYLAPEIINDLKLGYSFEVDIWSLGVLIYKMCYGKLPFDSKSDIKIKKKIINVSYYFPKDIYISYDLKLLISKLIINKKSKRLKLDEILNHPFLKNFSFSKYDLKDINYLKCPPINKYQKKHIIEYEEYNDDLFSQENSSNLNDDTESEEKDELFNKTQNNNFKIEKESIKKDFYDEVIKKCNYIVNFVDLSSKYGLGYKLSNGTIGVLFNDNVTILQEEDSEDLLYILKIDNYLLKKLYKKNKFPKKIINKVNLFYNFLSYMKKTDDYDLFEAISNDKSNSINKDENFVIFLKFYTKIKDGYLFSLNNKLIHTIFNDKTEFIFYMNKKANYFYKDCDNDKFNIIDKKFNEITEVENENFKNKFKIIKEFIEKKLN